MHPGNYFLSSRKITGDELQSGRTWRSAGPNGLFLADCASANSGYRNGAIAHLRRAVNTLMTFVGCMCHVFDRGFRHLMLHDPWAKPMMRDPKLWHSAAEPRSEPVARTERHGHVPSSAVALSSWRRTAVRVSAAAKLFGGGRRPWAWGCDGATAAGGAGLRRRPPGVEGEAAMRGRPTGTPSLWVAYYQIGFPHGPKKWQYSRSAAGHQPAT